ncbi:hypothetical protein EMIT043CA1_80156 [Pseudomonas brassicacearum]
MVLARKLGPESGGNDEVSFSDHLLPNPYQHLPPVRAERTLGSASLFYNPHDKFPAATSNQ